MKLVLVAEDGGKLIIEGSSLLVKLNAVQTNKKPIDLLGKFTIESIENDNS